MTFQSGYNLMLFVCRQKLESILSECIEWLPEGERLGGIINFFREFHVMLKQALKARKTALKPLKGHGNLSHCSQSLPMDPISGGENTSTMIEGSYTMKRKRENSTMNFQFNCVAESRTSN